MKRRILSGPALVAVCAVAAACGPEPDTASEPAGPGDVPRYDLMIAGGMLVDGSGDPSNHVLAGDILAPEKNDELAARVIGFVKRSML